MFFVFQIMWYKTSNCAFYKGENLGDSMFTSKCGRNGLRCWRLNRRTKYSSERLTIRHKGRKINKWLQVLYFFVVTFLICCLSTDSNLIYINPFFIQMQQNLTFYFSMFLNLFVHVEVPMFVCSFANILSQLDLILYFIYSYSLINSTLSMVWPGWSIIIQNFWQTKIYQKELENKCSRWICLLAASNLLRLKHLHLSTLQASYN
jgi:hypothetical protein